MTRRVANGTGEVWRLPWSAKQAVEAGEMAQHMKGLLSRCEDLSLDPRAHTQKQDVVLNIITPVLGMETGEFWGLSG